MQTNKLLKLTKIEGTAPIFAALIPVSGKGVAIPFILNPTALNLNFSASVSETQLYKSNSPSSWNGFKADKIQISGLTLTGGGSYDITRLINALRDSVKTDTVYNYVHGKRVIESVRVVSGTVNESMWLGGVPTEAEASLELMRVFKPPTVRVTVKTAITDREVKDALAEAVKLGYIAKDIKVSKVKGTVEYKDKLIGNWKAGKLVLVKDAEKAPIKAATPPKLPGATVPIKPSPTPPRFPPRPADG